jgi:hypothetical protein
MALAVSFPEDARGSWAKAGEIDTGKREIIKPMQFILKPEPPFLFAQTAGYIAIILILTLEGSFQSDGTPL